MTMPADLRGVASRVARLCRMSLPRPLRRPRPEELPTGRSLLIARVYAVAQFPLAAWIFYQAWSSIWIPDDVLSTVMVGGFTAFGCLILALNVRDAWFSGAA